MATIFHGVSRRPLQAGSWVIVYRHLRENTPLVASFLWKVVLMGYNTLALEAQDPDVPLQVQLTPELARRCVPIEPNSVLRLQDYPVEWRRWKAAGWDVYLTQARNGDLLLFAYKPTTSVSLDLPAGEVERLRRDPSQAKAFLMEALYRLVHPGKAKIFDEIQQSVPADELTRFIRRYEREERGK